jgi:hypothetical protein
MSINLARILGRETADTHRAITALEEKSGFPSEDIRLLSENKRQLRTKIIELNLDPSDTTDAELYHALRARFERDSRMLDKAVGVNQATGLDEKLSKAAQLVVHCVSTDEVWAAKNSPIKAILTKNPPKHVAKQLHYRSSASLIKREEIAEVCLGAAVVESTTWQKAFAKQLDKLSASQRELRPVKIVNLSAARWQAAPAPSSYAVSDPRVGAAAIWPAKELVKSPVLSLTLLLLEAVEALNPAGYSEALHELSPALRWWSDTGHLISDGRRPVSFNVRDVSLNHLHNHGLSSAVRRHAAQLLWDKLSSRYQALTAELSDRIPDIQYNFDEQGSLRAPTSTELAEEYASAE